MVGILLPPDKNGNQDGAVISMKLLSVELLQEIVFDTGALTPAVCIDDSYRNKAIAPCLDVLWDKLKIQASGENEAIPCPQSDAGH